ncbi:MAG: 3-deoxy-manno-octulosonate cytidylyltransferase [Phycisphaerales bacterium]|jgi:3-deoxy-manno-octulosonate cytidylyltransferase (CMP-KDO synthetase)
MAKPKAIAIIPARLGSTRFPGKALASDTGKPMVVHVCERAKMAAAVANVVVATDSMDIVRAVESHGFDAVMTSAEHENGTSRLAEAAKTMGLKNQQPIVNVQGDEPEIEPDIIDAALVAVGQHLLPGKLNTMYRVAQLGTVATPLDNDEDLANPNLVKAALGLVEPDLGVARALYFSRAPIPHNRDGASAAPAFRHVGIYAYDVFSLDRYVSLPPTPLEQCEKLEQLRWLEHGLPIAVAVRRCSHQGIDTPEQYAAFVERFKANQATA